MLGITSNLALITNLTICKASEKGKLLKGDKKS